MPLCNLFGTSSCFVFNFAVIFINLFVKVFGEFLFLLLVQAKDCEALTYIVNYLARDEPSQDVVQQLLVSSGECGPNVFSVLFGKWLKFNKLKLMIVLGEIISKVLSENKRLKHKRNELRTTEAPEVLEIVRNMSESLSCEKDIHSVFGNLGNSGLLQMIDRLCLDSTKKLFPQLFLAINSNSHDYKSKAEENASFGGKPESRKFENTVLKSENKKRSAELDVNKEKQSKKKKETWFFKN